VTLMGWAAIVGFLIPRYSAPVVGVSAMIAQIR
jgi:hypothetical protein